MSDTTRTESLASALEAHDTLIGAVLDFNAKYGYVPTDELQDAEFSMTCVAEYFLAITGRFEA